MYENPSAGKFGPPPEPPTRAEKRARLLRVAIATVLVVVALARWSYPSRQGWLTLLLGTLAIGSDILHLLRPPQNDKGPYREQTRITR